MWTVITHFDALVKIAVYEEDMSLVERRSGANRSEKGARSVGQYLFELMYGESVEKRRP
jgi:hypothetical protein